MDGLFCYHVVVMLLATVSFVFLWIAFATPGWLDVTFQETEAASEYTVSSLNRSLWYDLHCPQELKDCKTCTAGDASKDCVKDMGFLQYSQHFNWIEKISSDKEHWVLWGVFMIFVVLCGTIGFILVLVLVCCILKTHVYRMVAWSAFICWIIAGVIIWVPVGMIAHLHLEISDEVNSKKVSSVDGINHDASLHVPYSLVIAAVGGFLALVVAIMLLWLTGCCRNSDDSTYGSFTGSQVSDRYKSTVVRDGRYYGPYPYYPTERPIQYREADQPYYVRNTPSEMVVDEFPQYQKGLGTPSWAQNPWYDNHGLQ